ncbi:MAG: glycosyltransferase family 39 protein [Caldilineaceae bacterium]|nr:glycosyltransferase family 39 protein [Caldilineaceae bacterium]
MNRQALRISRLALLLLGFGLRVFRLDFQELRGDEAFGYFFSLRPWPDIVRATIELREPHPVASYFVEKGWITLVGDGEFALRFWGVCFSVLAIALLYRLARSLNFSPAAGTVAMAFMAVSPYAIWHAQDARMYSMSLALTLASSWLAVAWLRAAGRQRWTLGISYIIVSLLALHTHYYAAFVLVAHYLFVMGVGLWRRSWRTIVLPWLIIQGSVALLYLPWLTAAADTLTGYGGNGDSPGLAPAARRALLVLAGGESIAPAQQAAVLILAGTLVIAGTLRLFASRRSEEASFLLLYWLIPLAGTWFGAQQRPIFDERYLVAALPPFLLLCAAALPSFAPSTNAAQPRFRFTSWALLGGFLFVNLIALNRAYADPAYSKTRGWRELAAALTELSAGLPPEEVRIAQNFPDPTLWYYYRGPVAHWVLPPAPHDRAGAQATVAEQAEQGVTRVLLPVQPAPNWDDGAIASDALAARFTLLAERPTGAWPLMVYGRSVAAPELPAATWTNGAELQGVSLAPAEPLAGNILAVRLDWAGDQATPADGGEKVFVQLIGPDGTVIAQRDEPLTAWEPALYGLTLPASLPAGAYRLITGLYLPDQPGAPRVPLTEGGDFIEIRTWEITGG